MTSLICPKCSTEMDFITFLKALTPWHFKCSQCQAKLKLKNTEVTIVAGAYGVILGIFLGIMGVLFSIFDDLLLYLLFCAVVLIFGIILFEVIGYVIIKKYDFGLEFR